MFEYFAKYPHLSITDLPLPPFLWSSGTSRYLSSKEEGKLWLSHRFLWETCKLNYNSTQFIKVKHNYVYSNMIFLKWLTLMQALLQSGHHLSYSTDLSFAAAQVNSSETFEQGKPSYGWKHTTSAWNSLFCVLFLCKACLLFKFHLRPYIFDILNSSKLTENSKISKMDNISCNNKIFNW